MSLLELSQLEIWSEERKLLGPLDFQIEKGEWKGLVSSDGEGKSLLLRFLAARGKELSYRGKVDWNEKTWEPITRTEIFLVPEEPRIFEGLSVAQNLFLSEGPRFLPMNALTLESKKIFDQLPIPVPLYENASHLTAIERLGLEFGRMLLKPRKLLLLDEQGLLAASPLFKTFFPFLQSLTRSGLSILDAGNLPPAVSRYQLKEAKNLSLSPSFKRQNAPLGESALMFRNFTPNPPQGISDLTLDLKKGEIFGVLGSKSSGRRGLWNVLSQFATQEDFHGEVEPQPSWFSRETFGFVSGFRTSTGIFSRRDSIFNLTFPRPPRKRDREKIFTHYATLLRFENADPFAGVNSLTNDDRQKILFARCLKENPDIICIEEPFRGVSAATIELLLSSFRQLADAQKAILLFSSNPEVLTKICDRVLLFPQSGGQKWITPDQYSSTDWSPL